MALPNNNITPGRPPLLWSEVNDAFKQINENFDSIAATLSGGGGGLTPINFETLDTSVSPTDDNTYALGSNTKRWKYLYASEYSTAPGEEFNGVWLGTAHIQGIGGIVNLPANSTVDGSLIIDPEKTFFKEIQVDGGESIIATEFGSSLKITSGTAISVTVDSGAESLIIDNSGVTSLTGSTYIGVDVSTGDVTLTNLGVTTVAAGAAVGGRSAGAGISVSGATGNVTITNTGVLSVDSGSPSFITVSTDAPTGVATISFNSGAVATAAFRYVILDGDNVDFIEADNVADTLNIKSGRGINLTKNISTDTFTISVDNNLDINGSVFADDSSVMVDSIDQKIYAAGGFVGNLTGNTTGYHTGDIKGSVFGDDSTKIVDAVENKIFVPELVTTEINSLANTLVLRSGTPGGTGADLFINPYGSNTVINMRAETYFFNTGPFASTGNPQIEFTTAGAFKTYNGAYFEGNVTGNIFTNLIDSADSSAITVTPAVVFNSDVTVENELFIGSSRVINLDELKALVAASTDFADFQARIASLA